MPLSLDQLRREAAALIVEGDEVGFSIDRQGADPDMFNRLVREALDSAGTDFAAFPRTDGRTGYCALYVIPFT